MLKLALNKYEQHLWNSPPNKKFDDARVQRAYLNLQRSKQQQRIGKGITDVGPGTIVGLEASHKAYSNSEELIRKNRNNIYNAVKSPFHTNKTKTGVPTVNDTLNSKTKYTRPQAEIDAKKTLENIAAKPENKFLNRVKDYAKTKPLKAGLIAGGIGATLGAIGYGWKKELES